MVPSAVQAILLSANELNFFHWTFPPNGEDDFSVASNTMVAVCYCHGRTRTDQWRRRLTERLIENDFRGVLSSTTVAVH